MKRFWLALAAAYVALVPSFYLIFNPSNRITLLWSRSYHASIVTAIVALACLYFCVYLVVRCVVRRKHRLNRMADAFFTWVLVVVFVRSAVSLLDRGNVLSDSMQVHLDSRLVKIIYYMAIPLPLSFIWTAPCKKWVVGSYTVISPMVVFFLIWPLTYGVQGRDVERLPERWLSEDSGSSTGAEANIYVIILDEWSYDRTFPAGRLWTSLTNFAQFAETATVYHNAYSAGSATLTAIPRLLFQTDPEFPQLDYSKTEEFILSQRPHTGSTIFSEVGNGWFTAVVGFWHDYSRLLGDHVHFSAKIHNEAAWRTFASEVKRLLITQLMWLRYAGFDIDLNEAPFSVVWIYSQEQIHRLTLDVIRNISAPTFAVFHYCLPHYPYIWGPEGRKETPIAQIDLQTVDNYMNNLHYTDRVIGEILDVLKSTGKFDRSLLIFTSDHAWRFDPDKPGYRAPEEDDMEFSSFKHVPLMIKQPGQRTGRNNDAAISTKDLYPLMRSAITSDPIAGGP